ncbi:MAG: PIG-L family deacetylase [Gemmatimonadaceae bacterium]|nr:PIG-L family deacetylase [Gemmatimonadaceae bacterium]
MRRALALTVALCACVARPAMAQAWRDQAAHLGGSTRVLLIGTRPEDEDNALIAWLSRGRHVETAVLSLTRGEAGRNVIGAERNAPLAVVRTAELLAGRERDGAHQYFTRAFDTGALSADADVARAWPADSLLVDMVTVIRAFRPQVIVALVRADSEPDATRRHTARLAAMAFQAAADTGRLPSLATARLPAWQASRLLTRVDSAGASGALTRIDVGEFDRAEGRSYAEIGADIRRLHRTQGPVAAASLGASMRWLRLDSARTGRDPDLFGGIDTTLARLAGANADAGRAAFDSLRMQVVRLAGRARSLDADSLVAHLASVVRLAIAARLELECREASTVPTCGGDAGELALTLNRVRERATTALVGAAGLVVDANAERELVAAGDSAMVQVTVHNGGGQPVVLRRLALMAQGRLSPLVRDTAIALAPGATAHFAAPVRFVVPTRHWWQVNGMQQGTALQRLRVGGAGAPLPSQLLLGEDRLAAAGVEATVVIAGAEVPIQVRPLATRAASAVRGDLRHPVIGVPQTSILLERGAEYERAGMPVDRLFRVFVSNARSSADTVAVSLTLPAGLTADSVSKLVPLPPLSARNVFFRLRGALPAGEHTAEVAARSVAAMAMVDGVAIQPPVVNLGVVINEYAHIPAQHFVRFARDRMESVALRLPARFRVAYIRGTEDLRPAFQQLRLPVQSLDLALLPVADLSAVTAVIVGAGALRGEAALLATPVLRAFMARGGVVLVLPGGRELARSQLFPVPVEQRDPTPDDDVRGARITFVDPGSPLFSQPNVVREAALEEWAGDRSCSVATGLYAGHTVPLVVEDRQRRRVEPSVLVATVGKGRLVYTSLCLAQQLEAAQGGAAKLLVNLVSPWPVARR